MVDRLPTWNGRLLRHSGRLTLIKSTLFVGSIYMMISIKIPACVRKAMDKIMKVFLWTDSIIVQAGKCLVALAKGSATTMFRWFRGARFVVHGHGSESQMVMAALGSP
jgi:hypothetical protein